MPRSCHYARPDNYSSWYTRFASILILLLHVELLKIAKDPLVHVQRVEETEGPVAES